MGSGLIGCSRKIRSWLIMCHLLCFLSLCTVLHCVGAPVLDSGYLTSPYTEQTILFFSHNRHLRYGNNLSTIQVGNTKHILKKQAGLIQILFNGYTLDHVPEKLAQGIEFTTLIIDPGALDTPTPFDPLVLARILVALHPICAESLEFHNLDIAGSGLHGQGHSRHLGDAGEALACTANIDALSIRYTTEPTIRWLQKRINLSQSRINLTILAMLELDNLEVLDGFNAAAIVELRLCELDRLDSLECRLLREDPLPGTLILYNIYAPPPLVSEQILHKIVSHHWENISLPIHTWKELMKQGVETKHFNADILVVDVGLFDCGVVFPSVSSFPMGDNLLTPPDLLELCFIGEHAY
ncbi:hypothetical protein NEDG_00771 [Nematocida displodere]|uniref:Uncharacterized protein n=1 Tax=Nematocida displodere TaxID=1805483 RepID=A0A177ECT9_9MICR|nr:hypothetical protein NEDG_00771 [Nematocida displodere]